MPSEPSKPWKSMNLEQQQEYALAQLDKWTKIAASPNLSPAAAQAARELARSCRAAVTLGEKALAYRAQTRAPDGQADLMGMFGIKR
jgi:hypothetical protein